MENTALCLEGNLTFETVKLQRKKIQQHLGRSQESKCVIDLGGIHVSDSAGVALMLEAIRLARKIQKKVYFQSIPKQMHTMLRFCNLLPILETYHGGCTHVVA